MRGAAAKTAAGAAEAEVPARLSATGVILMALFTAWPGALGVGFVAVSIVGADEMSASRQILYGFLAVPLLAISARTGYELFRRLRGRA